KGCGSHKRRFHTPFFGLLEQTLSTQYRGRTQDRGSRTASPLLPRPDRAASSPYSVVRTAYPPSLASPPRRAWKNLVLSPLAPELHRPSPSHSRHQSASNVAPRGAKRCPTAR